jgi:hypothetical protein
MKFLNRLNELQLFLVSLAVAGLLIPGYGFKFEVFESSHTTVIVGIVLAALAAPLFIRGAHVSQRKNHRAWAALNSICGSLAVAWAGFLTSLLLAFWNGVI